jgi:tetratricopeptide (TPR) repeat protein/transcriptional regulator with XRE-family HTH domain
MAERPGDYATAGYMHFGGLLRAYRERGLLSQERLGERSGLSARTIRDLERRARRPRGESVRLLADGLGLVGWEREQFEDAARWLCSAGQSAARPVSRASEPALPHQLPPDVADFVGRAELVAQLRGWLARWLDDVAGKANGAAVAVCAVSGKAGVGKSALAVHVAHQLAADFPDGQLYASLRGAGVAGVAPLEPAEVLGRFLRAVGVDGGAVPAGVEERAALYRSRLAGRRLLVVLDDAVGEAQVRPLLPGSPGCAVLVTSRARLAGLAGARLVHLDVLDAGWAVELLARIAGPGRMAAEPAAATAIAAACGGLPLAVRIAGARLAARPHWSLGRMADLLADQCGRLDALTHGDLEVRASLSLSYQGLANGQRRLFCRLGLLGAPDVAAWVAGALLDRPVAEAEVLLEELVDAQLVDVATWDVTGRPRYRLHDLVRLFARERVHAEEPVEQRQAALERALGGWLALAEQADQRLPVGSFLGGGDGLGWGWRPEQAVADELLGDPSAWLEAEQAVLLSAIGQASTADPAAVPAGAAKRLTELAWRLAGAVTGFFWLRGCRDDYRRACDLALLAARRAGDRRGEAWMLTALAWVAVDQMRFERAMALAEQAHVIHREVGDRRGEAYALLKLGHAHEYCGRLDEAVSQLQHAGELYEELGDDHGRAWVLHTLGRVHHKQGRLAEAASDLEQALTISRRAGDRRTEAMALQELGLVHHSLGQPDQATALLLQSLQLCRESGDRLGEGFMLQDLGKVRLRQGACGKAASTFEQALDIFRRLGARRTEASVLRSLGELHHAQGRLRQARACLDAAVIIQRELGLLPRLARTLAILAKVQAATGDRAAARRSRREAHRLAQALGMPILDDNARTIRPAQPPATTLP